MDKICGVRLNPQDVESIIKYYGSFTNFVREKIKKDRKLGGKNGNANKRRAKNPTRKS